MNKSIFTPLPVNLVIAHRGTTYWAPEETEAAMRWARNIGADYLEFDLQRTLDGQLIALHDDNLSRTTDIDIKYPLQKHLPVSAFTYDQLLELDAGSWFNKVNTDRARKSFEGLDILTLEDVIQIAEGKRIKRDKQGKRIMVSKANGRKQTVYEQDPSDNGNRPGIYVETKVPGLFPDIEQDLCKELKRLGWYSESSCLKEIKTFKEKVAVANTDNRVILQTFSRESLRKLQVVFKRPLPTCFLLWKGTDVDDLPDDSLTNFIQWIALGKSYGATIIGPSIAGAPNNYPSLLDSSRASIIREQGLQIHAYSFDTPIQMEVNKDYVDGMFTNRSDLTLEHYNRLAGAENISLEILKKLGY